MFGVDIGAKAIIKEGVPTHAGIGGTLNQEKEGPLFVDQGREFGIGDGLDGVIFGDAGFGAAISVTTEV